MSFRAHRSHTPTDISSCSAGSRATATASINDPAAPNVRVVYPRNAIERIWQRNEGVAYVIAPIGIEYADILACV